MSDVVSVDFVGKIDGPICIDEAIRIYRAPSTWKKLKTSANDEGRS